MKLGKSSRTVHLWTIILAMMAFFAAGVSYAAKVQVCHVPPGNPSNFHTIQVNENALSAHLNHGDVLGACSENCDAVCDDGNICTQDVDVCDPDTDTVVCLADHPPVDCNDSNACSTDSCDSTVGCVYDFLDCTDPDLCTVDECNPTTGECENTDVVCDSGESCGPDTGECVADSVECVNPPNPNPNPHGECDPNPCHCGSCEDKLGHFICHCVPGWTGTLCEVSPP